MKWIEVLHWDEKSQSFFPSMELVPKSEEELAKDQFADKVCTWFYATLVAIIGIAAIAAIVTIATL